ncbi:MAG: hypothetical protein H6622_12965 [Halobacteriovoraceae bacterium]|nr:hypothetical protein [Halobacteriovoraceae bacterium]
MIKKIRILLSSVFLDKHERKFVKILKTKKKLGQNSDELILIEANPTPDNLISFYYLLMAFAKKNSFRIVSYLLMSESLKTKVLTFKFRKILTYMGVDEFLYVYPTDLSNPKIEAYVKKYFTKIKTKEELETLLVDEILLGDLVYDSYLRTHSKPTVILNSEKLELEFRKCIYYYLFWKEYLSQNNVKKIIVSHAVYSHFATIIRIALKKEISVYQANGNNVHKLNNERLVSNLEFLDFKERLKSIGEEKLKNGLDWAQKRLNQRFNGEVGVDMAYSTKSAWGEGKGKNKVFFTDKIKIFIPLHCFFDSPHAYGYNLFTDFYEWLNFLGEISKKTDYEWVMKTHPDFLPGNTEIIDEFIAKYPKLKLIPSNTSHYEIISSGVNFVLSVYGTVGFEYAYFNIPVINASLNNPHVAFNFNIHPKSIQEYEKILLNLENCKLNIEREEVLSFYYLKHYSKTNSWLWGDYAQMVKVAGGVRKMNSSNVYSYFCEIYRPQEDELKLAELTAFIDKENYSLR